VIKTDKLTLRIRAVMAIVGGFVVVAMGISTVALGGTEAHAKITGGSGTTVTQTTPPTTPETASASPTVKAPPPTA
jgi:hypothetical protein